MGITLWTVVVTEDVSTVTNKAEMRGLKKMPAAAAVTKTITIHVDPLRGSGPGMLCQPDLTRHRRHQRAPRDGNCHRLQRQSQLCLVRERRLGIG